MSKTKKATERDFYTYIYIYIYIYIYENIYKDNDVSYRFSKSALFATQLSSHQVDINIIININININISIDCLIYNLMYNLRVTLALLFFSEPQNSLQNLALIFLGASKFLAKFGA